MTFRSSFWLFGLIAGCTGGQLVTPDGQAITAPTTVTLTTCGGQQYSATTDGSGQFILNPYDLTSSNFVNARAVPEGWLKVRVGAIEYTLNHRYDQQCSIPWNRAFANRPCSKDVFVLGSPSTALTAPAGVTIRYPSHQPSTCNLYDAGSQQRADCEYWAVMSNISAMKFWQTVCLLQNSIR